MKKLFLILSICFITSCNNDDNSNQNDDDPNSNNALVGRWNLETFSPNGFAPTETYNSGDIIWVFNNDNTIDVTINITPNVFLPLNESGNYPFEIVSDDSVIIETLDYYFISEEQTLRLSHNRTSDGPLLIFQKTEN